MRVPAHDDIQLRHRDGERAVPCRHERFDPDVGDRDHQVRLLLHLGQVLPDGRSEGEEMQPGDARVLDDRRGAREDEADHRDLHDPQILDRIWLQVARDRAARIRAVRAEEREAGLLRPLPQDVLAPVEVVIADSLRVVPQQRHDPRDGLALVLVRDVGALPGVAGVNEKCALGRTGTQLLDLLGERDQAALGERTVRALDGVGDIEMTMDVVRVQDLDPVSTERDGAWPGRRGRDRRRGERDAARRDDERRNEENDGPS